MFGFIARIWKIGSAVTIAANRRQRDTACLGHECIMSDLKREQKVKPLKHDEIEQDCDVRHFRANKYDKGRRMIPDARSHCFSKCFKISLLRLISRTCLSYGRVFGTKRSQVQILSPRLNRTGSPSVSATKGVLHFRTRITPTSRNPILWVNPPGKRAALGVTCGAIDFRRIRLFSRWNGRMRVSRNDA